MSSRDPVLKTDLHTHSGEDPVDLIPYDARTLIDRAAACGYSALAITLHDKQLDLARLSEYSRERGIVLIPGIERTIRGKHVLLVNFPAAAAEAVTDFDDLRRLKSRSRGLVIAPHPFFPHPSSLGRLTAQYEDLFDAVELNAFYTRYVDFNRQAVRWAERLGKPVVANADVHRLNQLDTTYSLIDAEPDPEAICEAVRAGRVRIETSPLSAIRAARHLSDLLSGDAVKAARRVSHAAFPALFPSWKPHNRSALTR
jgi:predicted metal-dependent phosphoesterase TrpH